MALRKTKNSTSTTADPLTETTTERPAFELSLTQMIAGTAAAVTAALLGSRLGVAGTIIGAALASAVSMIAGAFYSHSIKAAKHRVMIARIQNGPDPVQLECQTGVLPVTVTGQDTSHQAFGQAPAAMMPLHQAPRTAAQPTAASMTQVQRPAARRIKPRPRLPTMVLAGIGALAAFGMSLILLTGIETVSGNPISGGQPGGLTILGGQSTGQADRPDGGETESSSAKEPSSSSESSPESTTPRSWQSSSSENAPSTATTTTSQTPGVTTTVTETVTPSDAATSSSSSSTASPTSSTTSAASGPDTGSTATTGQTPEESVTSGSDAAE